MSDDKNRAEELDRLRRDLEVLKRYDDRPGKYIVRAIEKVEGEIKRIEQEQVDPWAEAKRIVLKWCDEFDRYENGWTYGNERAEVAKFVNYLVRENAAKDARISELEASQAPFVPGIVSDDIPGEGVYPQHRRKDLANEMFSVIESFLTAYEEVNTPNIHSAMGGMRKIVKAIKGENWKP